MNKINYKDKLLKIVPKENEYSNFLYELNNSFQNELIHNNVDNNIFINNQIKKTLNGKNNIELSSQINPMFYLSDNIYFPPRFLFKPYKNVDLPKNVNLKLYNDLNNCSKNNI